MSFYVDYKSNFNSIIAYSHTALTGLGLILRQTFHTEMSAVLVPKTNYNGKGNSWDTKIVRKAIRASPCTSTGTA